MTGLDKPQVRFRGRDILRFLGAHLLASIAAGFGFMLVRAGLAIPSLPDAGALALTWNLGAMQASSVGGVAGILAVLVAERAPKLAGLIFPSVGVLAGLAVSVAVDQINVTFMAPMMAAGAAYGLCLYRFGWKALRISA